MKKCRVLQPFHNSCFLTDAKSIAARTPASDIKPAFFVNMLTLWVDFRRHQAYYVITLILNTRRPLLMLWKSATAAMESLMRITADEKAATRQRILDAAKVMFRTKGFDQTTTRDIARETGIAAGTMFNYFNTKEAVVVELAGHALKKAARDFGRNRREDAVLAEDLFASIAAQLRALRPMQKYIRPLLDTALSPVASPKIDAAVTLRADVSEQFVRILTDHGVVEPSAVTLNILWSLYVGVLTFWGGDKSPKQEDSLAQLDHSMRMFADWMSR